MSSCQRRYECVRLSPLVVVPARLLAAAEIGKIADAILFDGNTCGLALLGTHIGVETFERARWRVGAQNDIPWARSQRQQRFASNGASQQRLHAGCRYLHHADIAETIDGKAGQIIALGMDEPVEGLLVDLIAQALRARPDASPK